MHGLGFGRDARRQRVAPRLSARGLRVVAYDQRGHGASDASDDYSLGAFVGDLAAVVETLAIEEPVLAALPRLDDAYGQIECPIMFMSVS